MLRLSLDKDYKAAIYLRLSKEDGDFSVSGEKLEGTDALLYAETGYTAVEWKDSKYSYCFIADEAFDTTVWQALVSSIK